MKAAYFKKVIDLNGLGNIRQITSTALIKINMDRIQEGSFVVDEVNQIFSYIDKYNKETVIFDINDIDMITGPSATFVIPPVG
jgi:hypothetical protein